MQGMGTNVTRWATFDNDCLFRTFTGSDDALPYPTDGRDPSDIDVTERLYALYGLANFESHAGCVAFSGNFGIRWVKTSIHTMCSLRTFVITPDTSGDRYRVDPNHAR